MYVYTCTYWYFIVLWTVFTSIFEYDKIWVFNNVLLDNLHANSGHSRFGFVHYTDYLDVENAVTEIFKKDTK